jgi:hypothetical protein
MNNGSVRAFCGGKMFKSGFCDFAREVGDGQELDFLKRRVLRAGNFRKLFHSDEICGYGNGAIRNGMAYFV